MPATASTIDVATCDVAILSRLMESHLEKLPATAARALLKIDFEQRDRDRMSELSEKARAGKLTLPEQAEINEYERVGNLLDLLHSKARRALKKRSNGS